MSPKEGNMVVDTLKAVAESNQAELERLREKVKRLESLGDQLLIGLKQWEFSDCGNNGRQTHELETQWQEAKK